MEHILGVVSEVYYVNENTIGFKVNTQNGVFDLQYEIDEYISEINIGDEVVITKQKLDNNVFYDIDKIYEDD